MQAIEIGRNPAVQPLCNPLRLPALLQQLFVAYVAHKQNLRKHCGPIGAAQNDEGCLLHAPIRLPPAPRLQPLRERVSDICGKRFRFRDLLVACDFLDKVLKIVPGKFRERVFARRAFPGFQRNCQAQGVRFDAPRCEAGEAAAVASLERYEDRLTRNLSQLVNILDPDVMVLGEGVLQLPRLCRNVPQRLRQYVFGRDADTPVLVAKHGDGNGVRGAAWLWPLETRKKLLVARLSVPVIPARRMRN